MPFLLKLASTSFSDGFHYEEKPLNKRKRFPIARKSISTRWNEGFSWKLLFRYKKKLIKKISGRKSLNNRERTVSTSQKISCPLEGIISPQQEFFKNITFLLISIILSTSRKKALESMHSQNNVTFQKLDSPVAGGRLFLKYWIFPNFNISFHWRKHEL